MVNKISVVGLGKLGACTAACFASKRFETVGIDTDKNKVEAINDGKAPVVEPKLQELIDVSRERLRATQDYEEAINSSDVTFLIPPTPGQPDAHFSDRYLKNVLKPLASTLKESRLFVLNFIIRENI